jgi:rhodanese-related sulfurtransferase
MNTKKSLALLALVLTAGAFAPGCSGAKKQPSAPSHSEYERDSGDDEKKSGDRKPKEVVGRAVYSIRADEVDGLADRGAVIIDIRDPDDIWSGAPLIPGSINIPDDELDEALSDMDPNAEYIIVSEKGQESVESAARMRKAGFNYVFNLKGGTVAYWDLHPANAGEDAEDSVRRSLPDPSMKRRF